MKCKSKGIIENLVMLLEMTSVLTLWPSAVVQAPLKVRWGSKGEGRTPEDLGEAKIHHLRVLNLAGIVISDLTVSWGNKNRS